MNTLVEHARREFQAAGWTCGWDKSQEVICEQLIQLLEVFSNYDHSVESAHRTLNLFNKLAQMQVITPLTGLDDEWKDVSNADQSLWQNRRCSDVVKGADGQAYYQRGIMFYNWVASSDGKMYKEYFTSQDSRVSVQFPYTPTTVYQEYIDPNSAS